MRQLAALTLGKKSCCKSSFHSSNG